MAAKKIRVLVVDDSGLMRLLISKIVEEDPDMEVVETAADGKEAFEKASLIRPDVILLDLVMGLYDGLYAVKEIMEHTESAASLACCFRSFVSCNRFPNIPTLIPTVPYVESNGIDTI